MANLPTLAQKCAELHPYVAPGLAYTTAFIWSGVSFAIGSLVGWYVKGRGMTGVKIDLINAKMDIANLKGKLDDKLA